MAGWFPRRFRSRIFVAIGLIGTFFIVVCCYSNLTINVLDSRRNDNSNWFVRIWSPTVETCRSGDFSPTVDVLDTSVVYPTLNFAVPDNGGSGFWNEALESRYREIRKTWKELPLEVIVVPHSHVDPGWLRTYDDYSENVVNSILDNMVEFLNNNEKFTFIWAEVSYLSSWWNKRDDRIKDIVRKLIQRKQLEIVTGGWVMTDEAATSYFAVIDQLVEGHQWLQHFTNFTPKHGWSVDVFGHSASLPYILSVAGITETVILRAHYAWKAYLANNRAFDFYWKQPFPSPRMFCHMGPSDLYSFKHTCGPDQRTCLNYDFRNVGGEYSESTAKEITETNVELKASRLISQYGRFASLFPHNVLLVPLGDDFRYNLYMEWNQQFENYEKIFDFVNGKKDWNAHVRFGTVGDYFEEVNKRLQNLSDSSAKSLRGDFLPYGDIYANARPSYWTGFYTTRPFYKKLAQELEHWLRSSEILYSLTKPIAWDYAREILIKDYALLVSARQQFGLFQHHDAITGTSKENVMTDYGKRLHGGIVDAMSVMSHLTQIIFMKSTTKDSTWTSQVYPDDYRSFWNLQTKKVSLQVSLKGRKLILFNSLSFERTEVVRILVRSPNLEVLDSQNKYIPSQISPTWKSTLVLSNSLFELVFVAKLKPLSYTIFKLVDLPKLNSKHTKKATISLFLKDDSTASTKNTPFKILKPENGDIILENSELKSTFSSSGNLQEIYMKKLGIQKSITVDLKAYFAKDYKSGAYLFYPDTSNPLPLANLTDHFPVIYVVRGLIMSELTVVYHNFLQFTARLYHFESAPAGIQLEVSPDLWRLGKNIELIMQMKSDINSKDYFYTDSNGLQMIKRQYVNSLPVQGNYYPVTKAMYVEDEAQRLSILVPYSHGATSQQEGTIEIMIDRRLPSDDGRGVGEGVLDNKPFTTAYWLLLEKNIVSRNSVLSSQANALSLCHQYPVTTFIADSAEAQLSNSNFSFIKESWPSHVHLVNMRSLSDQKNYTYPSNDSLVIIMEDNNCKAESDTGSFVNAMSSTFTKNKVKSMVRTSLTGAGNWSKEFGDNDSSRLQACRITFS